MILSSRSFLFVAAAAACAVISGAWLYTRLMPMRFLESGYPSWVAKQKMLHECKIGSVLVVGDSRPEAAIIPAYLLLQTTNISVGGTTPAETYFFTREALKCPNLPRLAIYSHGMISYLSPSETLWKSAVRYGYIGFKDLRDMADVAVRTNDSTLSAVNTHDGLTGIVRDFIYSIGFPSVFVASLIEGRGIGRYTSNTEIFNRTTATRGQVTYSQPAANGLVGVDATVTDFVPSAMEIYYFNKTMDLFAAAHIRVMLLTVPVSETTIREIKPSNNAAFTALLGKRLSWDNNIAADLSRLVAWPDELYVDGSHLNDHGARIFSGRLAACLQGWDEGVGRSIPCDLTWK